MVGVEYTYTNLISASENLLFTYVVKLPYQLAILKGDTWAYPIDVPPLFPIRF